MPRLTFSKHPFQSLQRKVECSSECRTQSRNVPRHPCRSIEEVPLYTVCTGPHLTGGCARAMYNIYKAAPQPLASNRGCARVRRQICVGVEMTYPTATLRMEYCGHSARRLHTPSTTGLTKPFGKKAPSGFPNINTPTPGRGAQHGAPLLPV